jgi:hypothetical protein
MLPDKKLIGRYEIRRHVAHGGMGTLYLAHDPVLGRPVALKVFRGDLELTNSQTRFQREAEAAARLSHPNIVTIYDSGVYEMQPYMVMEFIDGQTLAHLIRRQEPVTISTKLRWMEELCAAVAYAHRQNVIHRDLKPLNLMVDVHGHLKVLDFGIARMRGALVSHTTAQIGTAGYMAPEQIRGGNIDHRSDLFSIGVVCYELISSVEPFAAEVDVAITNRILEEEPKPLQKVLPTVEPLLAELVWKALRKDPNQRFQDAESMRIAFASVRRHIEAREPDSGVRIRLPDAVREITPLPRTLTKPRPEGEATTAATERLKRDALVKERTAQVQTSLQAARESVEAGQFEAARAQCELVLKLDNSQPEALELLRRANLVQTARVALDRGQLEEAPGHAREALDIDANSKEAIALNEEAIRRIDADTGPIADPEGRTMTARPHGAEEQTALAPRPKPASKDGGLLAPVANAWRRTSSRQRTIILASVGTIAVVAVGAMAWVALMPGTATLPTMAPPPQPMLVVIDAAPWATVRRILRENGTEVRLPAPAEPTDLAPDATSAVAAPLTTPLTIQLLPGKYTVTLWGPLGEIQKHEVPFVVEPGKPSPDPTQIEPMTVDKYFESYFSGKPPAAARGGGA